MKELSIERRIFRYEIGGLGLLSKRLPIQPAAIQDAAQIAHVKHALNLIDIVAVQRQSRMPTVFKLAHDRLIRRFNIDAVDFIPWRHDVVHGHLLKIEDIDQHPAVTAGDHRSGFCHDSAQLFLGDRVVTRLIGGEPHQLQDAVGQ